MEVFFMFSRKHTDNNERLDRVAKLYFAYKFFGALYFTYPIFYEFASQAITPIQVGIFFSVIGICSFIAEIPTGIIADKRSRKLSGLLGIVLVSVAPLIIFFGHVFSMYIVAAIFYGVGRAFLSGALDSLVYDHKNISKKAYRRVNAFEITYGQAGILASAAFGGVFFTVNQGLPFLAEAVAGVLSLIVIALMQERHKDDYVKSVSSHGQHFIQSMKYLTETSYLRVLVLFGVVFSVMLGMCIQFVHEAAMIEQGLQASARGFLISGAGVATLVILNLFLLRFLKSDTARLIYMGFGAVLAYVLMSIGLLPFFLFGYLVWTSLNAISAFIRVMLQDQIPSSHRATIWSSYRTLAILVGLLSSTATGFLVQWAHTPRAAYALFGAIGALVLLPCVFWLISYLRRTRGYATS